MLDIGGYFKRVLGLGFRSSAISPMLWLNALVTAPCFVASFLITSEFRWAPFVVGCVVILYTMYKYNHLVNLDPRLVQSESFQIESQKLDIVARKGGPVIVTPVTLSLLGSTRQLPDITEPDLLQDRPHDQ